MAETGDADAVQRYVPIVAERLGVLHGPGGYHGPAGREIATPSPDASRCFATVSDGVAYFANYPMRYRSTKRFSNFPCAHRTHSHEGHCRFVHGYSRSFRFYFEAHELDEHNFVVDFSSLKELRKWLEHMFDHTLLIAKDDPEISFFREMQARELCDLRVVDSVSMEATAKLVFEHADQLIRRNTDNRAWLAKVEVHENDKNSAELERTDG